MFYIQGEVMSDKFDHLLEIQKKPKKKKQGCSHRLPSPRGLNQNVCFFVQKYRNTKLGKWRNTGMFTQAALPQRTAPKVRVITGLR